MSDNSALGALSSRIKRLVSRRDAAVFLTALLIIAAVHGYAFTNKLINHDDLSELFAGESLLSSGRWLLDPVMRLTGRISMPAVYGLMGSAWLALTVCVVARVLRIRRYAAAAATALAMAAHPSVVSTWSYMFTAPAYFFAMLLAVSGVGLIRRPGWRSFALGAALIAMSMGCYQAYLALAAALAVAALIADVCDGEFNGEAKPLLKACLRSLFGLLAGLAVYFAVLRLCLWATGTELTSYAGIDSMGKVSPGTVLKRVLYAYLMFFGFSEYPVFRAVHGYFRIFLILETVTAFLSLVYLASKRRVWKSPGTFAVFLALLACAPLAVDLVYVMADASAVHWLMRFPSVFVWIVPAAAADRIELPRGGNGRRIAAAAAAALLAVTAVTGYESVLITNKAYLEMEISRQSAASWYTRLLVRVEELEGYEPGMKLALMGKAEMPEYIPDEDLTGVLTGNDILNAYSNYNFLRYFLGFEAVRPSQQELAEISVSEEFGSMPCYPAPGSIRIINGMIAVKLSG